MPAGCDGCSLCCRLLSVVEIDKPAGAWCRAVEWTRAGGRCKVHPERPDACRTFECIWLQSQVRTPTNGFPPGQVLPPQMRPDRCGVVFAQEAYLNGPVDPDNRKMVLFVDPNHPFAWREPGPMAQINGFLARGGTVEVNVGSDQVTLRRGTGRVVVERSEPYYGMLRREVKFPELPGMTLDADELMRRRPGG